MSPHPLPLTLPLQVRLNVDHLMQDNPLPLYEYPETLSDAKPNFKRKDA